MSAVKLMETGWLAPIRYPSAVIRLLWPFWLPLAAFSFLAVFFPAHIQLLSYLPKNLGPYGSIFAVVVTAILANSILATALVNWHRFLVLGESDGWSSVLPTTTGWKYLGMWWLLYLPMALFQEVSGYFIQDLVPWSISSSRNADGSGVIYMDDGYYFLSLVGKVVWFSCMLFGFVITYRFWLKLPQIAVAGSPVVANRKLFLALAASISLMALIDLLFLAWRWAHLFPRVIIVVGNMIGLFATVWGFVALASIVSFAYRDARATSDVRSV